MTTPYKPLGAQRNKATAVKVLSFPGTTQQVGLDNSAIASMRAAVGSQKQRGSAGPY